MGELILRDGDYVPDGMGGFSAVQGREALLERRRENFYASQAKPAAREARALDITLDELKKMMERGYEDVD